MSENYDRNNPLPPMVIPLSPSEERTWAMLSHLSILINLFSGFFGPVAALIIYLIMKDRSRYVAYQSLQSFIFQLIAWVGSGILAAILWALSGILAAICIGVIFIPLAIAASIIPFAAIVYGIIAAVKTNEGQDFQYWLVGKWVRGTLLGSSI